MSLPRVYCIALTCIALLASGCATLPDQLRDVRNHSEISVSKLMEKLEHRRVIFVGEGHDSDEDHLMQLEVIRQLHDSDKTVVIATEVFAFTQQNTLDAWIYEGLPDKPFIAAYQANWNIPYYVYEELFLYARRNGIRLIGLNLPQEKIRQLINRGVTAEHPNTLTQLKYRSCSQEPNYANAMNRYWHRLGHKQNFMHMCDTRRFKEAVMASRLAEISNSEDIVVVALVGAIHALRDAIPEMLRRYGVNDTLILLPETLVYLTGEGVSPRQGDLVW